MSRSKLDLAVELGYIVPEWSLEDYIRDAIRNYGWESIVIWGPKGSGKSNLMLQIGYMVYQDWDLVLQHVIFEPSDFIRITKEGGRIPWLGWDDIGVHLPRTLYFTDRKLWSAFKRNWDAFRTNLSVFTFTIPVKTNVASFLLDDATGEIFIGKRVGGSMIQVYEFQRWMWTIDYGAHDKANFQMIQVEKAPLPYTPEQSRALNSKLPGVPKEVFKKYWEKRVELAEKARQDLYILLEDLEGKKAKREVEPTEEEIRKAASLLAKRSHKKI